MTDPRKIRIEDYTYELPNDKIARFPLEKRDESKLLIYRDGEIPEKISQDIFKNAIDYIPENSLLVFNDTKVIQARVIFNIVDRKPIEILCLEPYGTSIELALQSRNYSEWIAMVGNLKKWDYSNGRILEKNIFYNGISFTLSVEYVRKEEDNHLVKFSWDSEASFSEILESIGDMPIPPYLKRNSDDSDKSRYQTVYANCEGSVAAPTAGLHFTYEIVSALKQKNIDTAKVTLHVGAGTFKPVKSEFLQDHIMHREFVTIPLETLNKLEKASTIICVGTTSLRTIESIPYIANKIRQEEIKIEQWEPYFVQNEQINAQNAIKIIQNHLKTTQNDHISAQTGILIVPGFKFNFTNGLITNFHQPQSTLLLLIAAFIGQDWRRIYNYALQNDFRFLSYGDSSILLKY